MTQTATKKYRLLKAGQMVSVFRSTTKSPNGRDVHMTQNKVGRDGDEFSDLPEFQVDKIEASIAAGEEKWEVVEEAPDDDVSEDAPAGDVEPVAHGHDADEDHQHEATFAGLPGTRLQELVDMHALSVDGTGAQGFVKNDDKVKALQVEHGQA